MDMEAAHRWSMSGAHGRISVLYAPVLAPTACTNLPTAWQYVLPFSSFPPCLLSSSLLCNFTASAEEVQGISRTFRQHQDENCIHISESRQGDKYPVEVLQDNSDYRNHWKISYRYLLLNTTIQGGIAE